MEADLAVYFALFWNAFIAATLLPALSEVTLASLIANDVGVPFILFLAATAGNVVGSAVNWWLGGRLATYKDKRWFPFSEAQILRASEYFSKYGKWSLLFSWVPIIGDPITLVAGVLKTPIMPFVILVTTGKALRYGIILVSFTNM